MDWWKKKSIRICVLVDACCLVLAVCLPFLTSWMMALLPACPFLRFGFLCPSCGGTRCVAYLAKFDFAAAFSMNPYVFCLILYAGCLLLLWNAACFSGSPRLQKGVRVLTSPFVIIALAVGFVVFGVLRNFI